MDPCSAIKLRLFPSTQRSAPRQNHPPDTPPYTSKLVLRKRFLWSRVLRWGFNQATGGQRRLGEGLDQGLEEGTLHFHQPRTQQESKCGKPLTPPQGVKLLNNPTTAPPMAEVTKRAESAKEEGT